jgi:hypothetical protein
MHEPRHGLPRLTQKQFDNLLDKLSTPPISEDERRAQPFEDCKNAFDMHCRYRWRSPDAREPEGSAERTVIKALKNAVDKKISENLVGIDTVLYPHLEFERSVARERRVLIRSDRGEFRSAFLLEVNNSASHSLIFAGAGWAKFERAPVYSAILSGIDPTMYSQINIYSPLAFEEDIDLIEDMGAKLFFTTQKSSILADALAAVARCDNPQNLDRSRAIDVDIRRRCPGRAEIYLEFEAEKFLVDIELVPNLLNVLALAQRID